MKTTVILLILSFCLSSATLAGDLTFHCNFNFSNGIEYTNGEYKKANKDNDISFNIHIDMKSKKASLVGNAGEAILLIIASGDEQISFVQYPQHGEPIKITTTTTIFLKAGKNNNFPAVHSRHNNFFEDTLYSSQYYGFCRF